MYRHLLRALLAASISLLAAVGSWAAAPVNDEPTAALGIAATGAAGDVDTALSTSSAQDPLPSCAGGKRAEHTIWYRIAPKAPTILRVSATGRAKGAIVALYAATTLQGTEISCGAAAAAAPAVAEHLAGPKYPVYVMVGSTDAGGDTLAIEARLTATRWRPETPLAARRQSPAVTSVGSAIYSFGGLQSSYEDPANPTSFNSEAVNRFDPIKGTWAVVSRLPVGLSHGSAAVVAGRILLPGGRSDPVNGAGCMSKQHLVYQPSTKVWTTAEEFLGPAVFDYAVAADPSSAAYYMVGGSWDPTPCDFGSTRRDQQSLSMVRTFSLRTGKWVDVPPMQVPRQGPIAHVVNGYLIVLGGLNGSQPVGDVEVFQPTTAKWYRGASMPIPSWGSASGLGVGRDGRPMIYVAGGWSAVQGGGVDHGTLQVYDVRADKWTISPQRMTAREAAQGAVVGGRMYVVAGVQGSQAIRSVESIKVDYQPPKFTVRIRRLGARLIASVSAVDGAGVDAARIRWRLPGGAIRRGRSAVFTAPARVTVVVVDRAGNITSRAVNIN